MSDPKIIKELINHPDNYTLADLENNANDVIEFFLNEVKKKFPYAESTYGKQIFNDAIEWALVQVPHTMKYEKHRTLLIAFLNTFQGLANELVIINRDFKPYAIVTAQRSRECRMYDFITYDNDGNEIKHEIKFVSTKNSSLQNKYRGYLTFMKKPKYPKEYKWDFLHIYTRAEENFVYYASMDFLTYSSHAEVTQYGAKNSMFISIYKLKNYDFKNQCMLNYWHYIDEKGDVFHCEGRNDFMTKNGVEYIHTPKPNDGQSWDNSYYDNDEDIL